MIQPMHVALINKRLYETLPMTPFTTLRRFDDGIGINYFKEMGGIMLLSIHCRLAPSCTLMVAIPDEEFIPSVENAKTIAARIAAAVALVETPLWN